MSSTRPSVGQIETGQTAMPDYHQSPSSSVSSASGSDVVFSQPALAANRDNDLVIDLDTDDEYSNGIFAWPSVESPAAHHTSLRPSYRALLLTSSGDVPSSRSPRSSGALAMSMSAAASERRRHAIAIALSREAEQAADRSTSLARRIAARDLARTGSSPSPQQDQFFPSTRLSRTIVSVAEPDPPPDLRRLATTREAERQLQHRDWHRLGLLDPPAAAAGPDGAGISPGRMRTPLAYARRRSSAATIRTFPSAPGYNEGQDDDIDVLSMDLTPGVFRRRSAALDTFDPITDSQLEGERERDHDPSAPIPSLSSSLRSIDRRLARFRSWPNRTQEWEDGRDDPNGENVYNEQGQLATPAGRSRYWNALSNAATDDLLALAAERSSRPAPSHPPGLAIPATPELAPMPSKPIPSPDPLPNPLGTMLRPTPKKQFIAAFRAS